MGPGRGGDGKKKGRRWKRERGGEEGKVEELLERGWALESS